MIQLSLIIILSFTFILRSQTGNNSYFPLAIGNEWHYTSNLFSNSESIIDTMIVDDAFYYVVSTNGIDPRLYYREKDNKVFVRKPGDSIEVKLYNFDAEIEESWELSENFACSFGVEVTLASKDDTIDVPIGTFYNCYHFRHMSPCSDAGIIDTWFAKGIGKVKYSEEFYMGIGNFELTDYIVTKIDQQSSLPENFNLSQNYPNPFGTAIHADNPTTKIKFSLTRPSVTLFHWERDGVRVSLKIYDLLGREMATLINESKPPGTYEVEFDGSQLPSGVYFYRLNAGKYSETKKMVLMR